MRLARDSPSLNFHFVAGKYLLCAGESKTLEINENASVHLFTRCAHKILFCRTIQGVLHNKKGP